MPNAKAPVTPFFRTPLLAKEGTYVAGIVVILLLGILVQGYVASFQEAQILTVFEPENNATFSWGDVISFKAVTRGGNSPFVTSLYLRKGTIPDRDSEVYSVKLLSGEGFDYLFKTKDGVPGTYYWRITTMDKDGLIVSSPNYHFTVNGTQSTSEENQVDAYGEGSGPPVEDDEGGGLGGHYSDTLGEKTILVYGLKPGQIGMIYFNKTAIHSIEKVRLQATDTKLPSNGFIIHQEFEKDRNYTIPDDDGLYKAIHIQTTSPWKFGTYLATIYFRIPRVWVESRGYDPHNVVMHRYQNGKLSHTPTYLVSEKPDYFEYEATMDGLYPFFIGADRYTWNGIPTHSTNK